MARAKTVPGNKAKQSTKKQTQTAVRRERAQIVVPHPGPNFTSKHYVFIGAVKAGELWALNSLSTQAKAMTTPLLQLWQKDGVTLQNGLTKQVALIAGEWGSLPVFIDASCILLPNNEPDPLALHLLASIAPESLNYVPVTMLSHGESYQQRIKGILDANGRGVMLRLGVDDFINPALLPNYINGLLTYLGVTPSSVDLLIDYKHKTSAVEVRDLGLSHLAMLPYRNEWRTLTLGAACFPNIISHWPYGVWNPVSRADWLGWLQIFESSSQNGLRAPAYSDYGIRSCIQAANVPNTPAPNIRYTNPQTIFVKRGPKQDGVLQQICADLVSQPFYSGSDFSVGDQEIAARAANQASQSNSQAQYWIKWCANHHAELTTSQIRSLL